MNVASWADWTPPKWILYDFLRQIQFVGKDDTLIDSCPFNAVCRLCCIALCLISKHRGLFKLCSGSTFGSQQRYRGGWMRHKNNWSVSGINIKQTWEQRGVRSKMKTLCVVIVVLSFTSVCQPASLACQKLLKPAETIPVVSLLV